MPNPPIHRPGGPAPAEPTTPSPNGILAYVGGQYISQGSKMLPKASEAEASEPRRSVVLDVPDLGLVRVTYQLSSYRHRAKSKFWHWPAVHAEKVEPAS